jgi:uncharacterized protein (DUF2236 family)
MESDIGHEIGDESLMHREDSITLRYAGDVRNALMAGRTFVMQVAHPAVGAGVDRFSAFRKDPWGRLEDIARSQRRFVYQGVDAARAEGERLRRIHRNIEGQDSSGRAYHSLDPDVYGWVHTVFFDTTVTMCRLYGEPLSPSEERRLFAEWREGGRLLGLSDRDLPASIGAYRELYDDAIENRLEYNAVVRDILVRTELPPPPSWRVRSLWPFAARGISASTRWLALGSLPPRYREKISAHHPWSDRDERAFRRFCAVVRRVAPRLPPRLRYFSDAYESSRYWHHR